jgi:hypothetical protein
MKYVPSSKNVMKSTASGCTLRPASTLPCTNIVSLIIVNIHMNILEAIPV